MAVLEVEVIVRTIHTDRRKACPFTSTLSERQMNVQIEHAFGSRVAYVSIEGSSTMQIVFSGGAIRIEREGATRQYRDQSWHPQTTGCCEHVRIDQEIVFKEVYIANRIRLQAPDEGGHMQDLPRANVIENPFRIASISKVSVRL